MQGQATKSIDCQSCGVTNSSDMSFCLQCGKVLNSDVEAKRELKGIKKRKCNSCGKADELNNRYCIFCGAEVKAIAGRNTNPVALAKFSQELAKVAPEVTIRPVSSEKTQQVKVAAPPQKASSGVPLFLALGLICGAGLAYFCGGENLAQTYLLISSDAPKNGLVAFVDRAGVNVIVESDDRTHYTLGQTGKLGTISVADMNPGFYRLKFSFPGCKPLLDTVNVAADKLNLLGFDQKIVMPEQSKEGE